MMATFTVSKRSFNGEIQQSKLNITEQHLPISNNVVPKPYNQETTFTSPYLDKSQTSPRRKINLQNSTVEDEISIFDAQKYFNEGNETNHTIKLSPVTPTDNYDPAEFPCYSSVSSSTEAYSARNYRARSFHATPTASSEASWNSQTGLLSNPQGTIKVSLHNINPAVDKRKMHGTRWFFRRNCPCIGKKSTQVDDKTVPSEARSPVHFRSVTSANLSKQTNETPLEKSPAGKTTTTTSPSTHRMSPEKERFEADQPQLRISLTAGRNYNDGSGFTFPILQPSTTPQAVTMSKNQHRVAEDPPRDSLDVFLPPNLEIPDTKMMTSNLIEDDAASDGSSDLFEIESFSTQTTYQVYNNSQNNYRRDSLDEAANFRNPRRLSVITSTANNYRRNSLEEPATPSVAPTEGYEPSEASIDWSVTTAEGFDRASIATCDDMMMMVAAEQDDGGAGGGGRRNSGSRGNGLLGLSCRSEKAVMVGPGPRRVGPGVVGSVPVPQHVGGWAYTKPPLASRSNQAHKG
ncbi:hypothetical protein QQ045_029642 [Rhodiola kirilowii]